MKQTENILFDLDGTLVDSAESIINTLEYIGRQMGADIPSREALRTCVGPPLRSNIAFVLKTNDPTLIEEGVRHYDDYYVERGQCVVGARLYDGVIETLKSLQASGKTMFIATSKYIAPTLTIAEHFGLTPFFKKIYGSTKEGHLSDKTQLLAHIVKEQALDPARTVMVGDRKHDAIGAKNNHIPCIGALWGIGSKNELEEAGVAHFAAQPGDLGILF